MSMASLNVVEEEDHNGQIGLFEESTFDLSHIFEPEEEEEEEE